jgi:hypothetical protein
MTAIDWPGMIKDKKKESLRLKETFLAFIVMNQV